MALDVKLAADKTELLYQEDALLTLTLTNAGNDPLSVTDPATLHSALALKVLNVKTGVERVYTIPREGRQPARPEKPLPPKKSISAARSLQDLAYLDPGEYDLSVAYPCNKGAQIAESAPLRLKIAPTTPRNLVLDGLQPDAPAGFWIDLAGPAPELVRTRFDIQLGAKVRELVRLGKASLRCVAVPSRPPNGVYSDNHWVAWIDGKELLAVYADQRLGVSSPVKMALPAGGELSIVHPLASEAPGRPEIRPGCSLLLQVKDRDRGSARLVPVSIGGDRAAAGTPLDLPGPAPVWISVFQRSDKKKLIVFAQAAAAGVALFDLPWTGGAPRKLGEFKGEFLAAAVTPAVSEDRLRGCLLLRGGIASHLEAERTDFEIAPDGAFQAKAAGRVNAEPSDYYQAARLRVSRTGEVAALLQDQKGAWHAYDGKTAAPLPLPWKTTEYPLDLAFKGDADPVLLAGFKEAGFRILTLQGLPLPETHH